jgi:hypothetical protein
MNNALKSIMTLGHINVDITAEIPLGNVKRMKLNCQRWAVRKYVFRIVNPQIFPTLNLF